MSYISVNDLISKKEPFKYKCLLLIHSLELYHSVQNRAKNPRLIYQNDAPLCGPAAFLYCIIKFNPDIYSQYIYHLALKGTATIGSMNIKPREGCKNADLSGARIDPVDWVGLASLRDSTNQFLPMTSISDNLAGMTGPDVIADWFAKTRLFEQIINKTNLFLTKPISNLVDANRYYRNGYKVCLFINAKMILDPSSSASKSFSKGLPTSANMEKKTKKIGSNVPNHWVVLESNMMLGNEYFNGEIKTMEEKIENNNLPISFNVYSWGGIYSIALNWDILSSYYYGYIAVK